MKKTEHLLPASAHENAHQIWMVPYARDACFTGREEELQEIAATLDATNGQAISGAGGIGKTQLALEYAYRHCEEYRYVFWVLAETRETLNAAYSDIAELLDLPEKREQEHLLIAEAVKRWLANRRDWLLILDHVMDLGLMKDFLPPSVTGHLLLTTRASTTGKLVRRIKLKMLDKEQSTHLLLRRNGSATDENGPMEVAPGDYEAARAIVGELGGLPLALDLAGAYIAATSCDLPAYLELLRRQQATLDKQSEEQPGPAIKALRLSCEKLARTHPEAFELLHLCVFLAPDEIPETLFIASASTLTKPLQKLLASPKKLNMALAILQKYALVTRDLEVRGLAVQREVQAAFQNLLRVDTEKAWATRLVRALGAIFTALDINNWEDCQRLLPHAQACAALIDRYHIEVLKGAWLLHHMGWYLHTRGEYVAAQAYEEKALAIYRAVCGDEHPSTAMILNNLAVTLEDRGRLKDAAVLHQQALAIRRNTLGTDHAETAASLNNLACVYHNLGKLEDAATLYRESLAIRRKLLGSDHAETAASLNGLALAYHSLDRFEDALTLHQQVFSIRRKVLGNRHPETLASCKNLAAVYQSQGKFVEALAWLQRTLTIQRKVLGDEHPALAETFNSLAEVYCEQGKLDDATFWLQQALAIQSRTPYNEQSDLANMLARLALAYEDQEQHEKAEALYRQALTLYHTCARDTHPDTARCLYYLALLCQEQKRYTEARTLLERALDIWQAHYGPNHAETKKARERYEHIVQKLKQTRGKHEQMNSQVPEDSPGHKRITRMVQRVKGN